MLLVAAVVATLSLDGTIPAQPGDYVAVTFEVPAGVAEIQVSHQSVSAANILDWGLWDPDGFRGWGGGLVDDAIVGENAASRGYLPGPIPAGTWTVMIGKAKLVDNPADYTLTVTLRDAETEPAQSRADFAAPVLATGARWYRGDFHVHSFQSGDASATFEQIHALARTQRLDFVALSDHNTVSQQGLIAALQPSISDLLFIRAAEITTYGGHANGLGISDYVDHRVGYQGRDIAGIVADVRAQGGIISVSHPALDLANLCLGCAWAHVDDTPWDDVSGIEIQTGNYDATIGLFTPRAIDLWETQVAAGHHLAAIGGSDDHRAGTDTGPRAARIGQPTTLVYADELSEAAILDGIRAGHTIVMMRGPDDPMLELTADAGDAHAMIGDTIAGHQVTLTAQVTGGRGLSLVLYRNGEATDTVPLDSDDATQTWNLPTSADGDRYHAELQQNYLPVTVTSHIFVTFAPADGGGCCNSGADAGWLVVAVAVAFALRRRRRAA